MVNNRGTVMGRRFKNKELTPRMTWMGYPVVVIDGRSRFVHRLVYEAFKGKIASGYEINHKNGNRGDPRLENLESVTRLENIRHAHVYLGKGKRGMRGRKKLTKEQVKQIEQMRAKGVSVKELMQLFGVSQVTIWAAAHGKVHGGSGAGSGNVPQLRGQGRWSCH